MTYTPVPPQSYQGNQVILNSDRLLFNAKSDSILLFSDKVIGFSTNGSFHFDTSSDKNVSKFIVNSPNIYLGLDNNNILPTQPAVLADDLITSLEDIFRMIENVYADIAFHVSFLSTTEGTLTGLNTKNFRLLQKRQKEITKKIENLEDIKSKNTKLI